MKKKFIGYLRKCDMLTMFGTSLAFIGMYLCSKEHFTTAVFLLLICGICDGFDGTLARKYKYSEKQKVYGSELDSLSDAICFGLFPAFITISLSDNFLCLIISILFMLCGVIRLAYFNMLAITKSGKKKTFIGFPITTSAIIYPIIFVIIRLINFNLLSIVMPIILVILGIMFIINIELPKPDVPALVNKIFNKYVVTIFILPTILILSSDIFYRFNLDGNPFLLTIESIINNPLSYMLVYVLILSIIGLFLGITKTTKRTKIIVFSLITILLLINDIKLSILEKPLMVSDISFLNPDNIKMMGTTLITIGPWIYNVLFKTIILSLIYIIFVILDKYHSLKINNNKLRASLIIGSFIVFIIIIIPMNSKNDFINKNIFNNNEIDKFYNINNIYIEYGLIGGMYYSIINSTFVKPNDYNDFSEEKISINLEKEKKLWPESNVIFILSESYFDLDNITEIEFNKNLTPNIDKYIEDEKIKSFDLLVPTYGGASVNTEFEILTGFPLSFTKLGYIPFNEFYINKSSFETPNLIKEFNNNNYKTMYITPWGPTSYNSKKVYTSLGIDKTIYNIYNGISKGYYYSDESLFNDIYNVLLESDNQELLFIMSASSQNHYPYDLKKYKNYDIEIENTLFSKTASNMLKSYAQGIYDTDKAIKNLYENIQKLDKNTIIVIYGDHLPSIVDNDNTNVLFSSDYLSDDIYGIKKYTTKAYIMANFELGDIDISYLNSSYLGSYILNKMENLKINNYYKIVDEFRKKAPAFNRFVYYDNNTSDFLNLDRIEKEFLNDYKNLTYKYFIDGDFK